LRDEFAPGAAAGTKPASPSELRHTARGLALGFGALLALVFGLIVLGALVRAHGAGLACPDWPLCFGEVVPRFDLKVAFEWSHRAVAGVVALVFTALSWRALREPALRPAVRGWIAAGALLLALQILLGALTVWQLLAQWTVTSHLLTGNAFAVTLLLLAQRLFELAKPPAEHEPATRAARGWLGAAGALLLFQLAVGGLVSSSIAAPIGYAGLACPEWPACMGGEWFPSLQGAQGLHLLHRYTAAALLALLLAARLAATQPARLRHLASLALALGLAQTIVGIANVLLRVPVEVTGLHSALASALVFSLALALREAWRRAPA